jgi:hypothetical protein
MFLTSGKEDINKTLIKMLQSRKLIQRNLELFVSTSSARILGSHE